jgi:hypothetical protein
VKKLSDWDKRVSEACNAHCENMRPGSSIPYIDDFRNAWECRVSFEAGANFAWEILAKDNFQEMMKTGIYEAESKVAALRQQCEAMAEARKEISKYEPTKGMVILQPQEALKQINFTAIKAVLSYHKFKEGGE